MSGYADRYDGPDDREPEGFRDPIARARARVQVPAILLIVIGGLAILLNVFNLINLPNLGPQLDEQLTAQSDRIDQDAQLTADQKKQQKDMLRQIFEAIKSFALPFYLVNLVVAGVVLLGGVKMLTLSSRGLAITGSVLAMIPIINGCCCVLGLPVGIWALVALGNADVKAGFAARSRGSELPPPDAY
jgi:hypothetical protein